MSGLSHLDELEAEAIYIIREVAAECEKPVMLYSIGKRQLSDASSRTESLLSGKTTFPVFTCKYNLEIQGNDRVS